jgi:hypothetical protein
MVSPVVQVGAAGTRAQGTVEDAIDQARETARTEMSGWILRIAAMTRRVAQWPTGWCVELVRRHVYPRRCAQGSSSQAVNPKAAEPQARNQLIEMLSLNQKPTEYRGLWETLRRLQIIAQLHAEGPLWSDDVLTA